MAESWLCYTNRLALGPVLVRIVGCGWRDGSWLMVFWGWVVRLDRFRCGLLIGERWVLGLGESGGVIVADLGIWRCSLISCGCVSAFDDEEWCWSALDQSGRRGMAASCVGFLHRIEFRRMVDGCDWCLDGGCSHRQ